MKSTPSSRRLQASVRQETLDQVVTPVLEQLESRLMLSTHRHGTSATVQEIAGGIVRVLPGPTAGYSPAQIRKLYGLDSLDTLNRNFPLYTNVGEFQKIVIIGAAAPQLNDRPAGGPNPRLSNLNQFDAAEGVKGRTSQSVFEDPIVSTTTPGFDPLDPTFQYDDVGAMETTMQLEWANAMAPHALLSVVEVPSVDGVIAPADLQTGISEAVNLLQELSFPGPIDSLSPGGIVLMGLTSKGEDPATEALYDQLFSYKYAANVSFIAPSGEFGSAQSMPATSPWVTSVGGTVYDVGGLASSGKRVSETASLQSGGGPSLYEPLPAFQNGIKVGGKALTTRSGPDLSLASQANGTGVSFFYDPTDKNNATQKWFSYEGTEVSAAIFTGMVADANELRTSLNQGPIGRNLNNQLYSLFKTNGTDDFTDVTEGNNILYQAQSGFDLATGAGTPYAYNLIPNLGGVSTRIHKATSGTGAVVTQNLTINKFNGDFTASLATALTGSAVTAFGSGSGTAAVSATTVLLNLSSSSTSTSSSGGVTTISTFLATLTNANLVRNLTTGAVTGTGTVTITGLAVPESFRVAITGTLRVKTGRATTLSGSIYTIDASGKRVNQGLQDIFTGSFST